MKLTLLIFILNVFCAFGQVEAPSVEFPNPKVPTSDSVVIFCSCDAQFPGGAKAMKEHIYKYVTPIKEGEQNEKAISKQGYVTFVVEPDGRLMDIEIYRGISPELDDLMLRIIEEMPRWIPACDCYGNGPVRSRVRLPFTFIFPADQTP